MEDFDETLDLENPLFFPLHGVFKQLYESFCSDNAKEKKDRAYQEEMRRG